MTCGNLPACPLLNNGTKHALYAATLDTFWDPASTAVRRQNQSGLSFCMFEYWRIVKLILGKR